MKALFKWFVVSDEIKYTSINNPNITILIELINVKNQTYTFKISNAPKIIERSSPMYILNLYCGCRFNSIEELKQKVEELLK